MDSEDFFLLVELMDLSWATTLSDKSLFDCKRLSDVGFLFRFLVTSTVSGIVGDEGAVNLSRSPTSSDVIISVACDFRRKAVKLNLSFFILRTVGD